MPSQWRPYMRQWWALRWCSGLLAMALNLGARAVPDSVRNALAEVSRARGWKNPRFTIETGSKDGEGYLSIVFQVLIQNEDESLPIICKTTMSKESTAFTAGVFKAETFMYCKILPAMEEIAHLSNHLPWPRGYPVDEMQCVVMEDLRVEGFAALTGKGPVLDAESCRLLVVQLARLHGGGMALEQLRPDLMADFRKITDDAAWKNEMAKVYKPFLDSVVNAADLVTDRFPKGSEIYEKLKNLFASYPDDFVECVLKADPEGGNTIVHGDCHVNNVLFQRNKVGLPVACRLIDFQLVNYASPVVELTHALLAATEKETRDHHWHALMEAYFDELQTTLRAAGIQDPESLYSRLTFQRQLRRAGRLALGWVPAMLHVFCDDDSVQEIQAALAPLTGGGAKASADARLRIKDTPLIRRRLGDAVESVIEWGCL